MTLESRPTRLHLSQEQLGFTAAQAAQSAPPDACFRRGEIPFHIPASGGAGAIRQRCRLILVEPVRAYTQFDDAHSEQTIGLIVLVTSAMKTSRKHLGGIQARGEERLLGKIWSYIINQFKLEQLVNIQTCLVLKLDKACFPSKDKEQNALLTLPKTAFVSNEM